MDPGRLLVVSPVHNEAKYLELVARALARQSHPPEAWVVVDDGSQDATPLVLERLSADLPFLTVVRRRDTCKGHDRLAEAAAPRAFNEGLASTELDRFDYVAKLDGDVELPPDYFEMVISRMRADPLLGIACGDLVEPDGEHWKRLTIPSHHVHGALKLYSRDCFRRIGGVQECLGWDTIDETYARMHGYRTRSFSDVVALHHRPSGMAQGRLMGQARHGACAWIAHYGLGWVLLRSLKVGAQRHPRVISAFAFVYGYLRAAAARTPRVDDPEFRRYVRRELRGRIRGVLNLRAQALQG